MRTVDLTSMKPVQRWQILAYFQRKSATECAVEDASGDDVIALALATAERMDAEKPDHGPGLNR